MTKYYSILPEYYDDWAATLDEHIVTEKTLESTARGWGKPLEYVKDTVKEFSPSDYVGEEYDDPTGTFKITGVCEDMYSVVSIGDDANKGKEYLVSFSEVDYFVNYAPLGY